MAEAETMPEKVDYERVLRFHGFNHDMNYAHSFVPHAKVIALAMLAETARRDKVKFETLGDAVERILGDGLVVSPGILHLSMLEHYVPQGMVIAKVSTKFGDPLYVPFSGESVDVSITKTEKPYVAGVRETPGIVYHFEMSGPNIHGDCVPLFGNKGSNIVAFPGDMDPSEIFKYVEEEFRQKLSDAMHPIDSAGKDTNITHEHDGYYWSSIRPSSLPREAELPEPIRRAGKMSQLEMLAKLPRVLSLYREKLETEKPAHLKPAEPTEPFFQYAELEKSKGLVADAGKRACQLANRHLYVYGTQDAVFDPRQECPLDRNFALTTFLTRQKTGRGNGGMHVFVSQMVVGGVPVYADTSMFFMAPVIPEAVMKLLYDRNLDVNSMKPFG